MFKKLSALIALFIASALCMPVSADIVSEEVAMQTANTFLALDDQWHSMTDADIQLVSHNNIPAYYIIEYKAGGWAIVAAQSTSSPIIGYNTTGKFARPEPVDSLLNFNAKIITTRALDLNLKEHKGWSRVRAHKPMIKINDTPDVAPLITINLDQSDPFNKYCPEVNGQNTLVGCVAVAMTQALMVQRYPKAPQGKVSYNFNAEETLSLNFNNEQPYDWDGMYNGNVDEIARLAYHSGVSVEMLYGVYSSGTYTQNAVRAFVRHFGYDEEKVKFISKTSDVDKWLSTIVNELAEGRVVVYRGDNGSSGHCWNVDGWKQSTQMVHCNWGWNGEGNGYFNISNMTDSYQGLKFLYSHQAVIGVGAPSEAPYDIVLSNSQFSIGTNPGTTLAEVKVLSANNDATYNYELFYEKSNNTPTPYKIENGKLISTATIGESDNFKIVYIKATNTETGKAYEKSFKLQIVSQNAKDLEGSYQALATIDGDGNKKEWTINITIDENDSNKVWLHPMFSGFSGLSAQHIKPIYATYDSKKRTLTLPLGQILYKGAGYHMVNAATRDGKNTISSGDVVLPVAINDKGINITFDPTYYYGVADINNNNKWHQALKELVISQEKTHIIDIKLSQAQIHIDNEVGTTLSTVTTTSNDPDMVITYELFGPKDENFNYTTSPYQIVDGKLISTEPLADEKRFKQLYIKATNTHTGDWLLKEFTIRILTLRADMLVGKYHAFAKSAFQGAPDEEWEVTITADEKNSNILWIQPICLFGSVDVPQEEISPVYATIDAANDQLLLPLGQIIHEPNEDYKFVIGETLNGSDVITSGETKMLFFKNGDIIDICFGNYAYFGIGNIVANRWFYQALYDIAFTNRNIISVDSIYYNITGENSVAVSFKGVDSSQFLDEYIDKVSIPESIVYDETTYSVTSIGEAAFYNCENLKAVEIPESINEIADYAFGYCISLSEITVKATTPPIAHEYTFTEVDYSIPLIVPAGCAEAYKNAPYWNRFFNINEESGIDQVETDNIAVTAPNGNITIAGADPNSVVYIYNMSGMLLYRTTVAQVSNNTLPQGIYLVQVEDTMHKVVI